MVAYAGTQPVACGAIRRLDDSTVEIKRMYAVPEFRGTGVARSVLATLIAEARRLEATRAVLETGQRQPEALGLYLEAGFVRTPPFGEYHGSSLSVCMAKTLRPRLRDEVVTTRRLVLSPLAADDAEPLFAYRSDPEVRRYQFFEPQSLDDAQAFVAPGPAEPSGWHQFGIRLRSSAELAGDIGYKPQAPGLDQAEIGVTLAPAFQRRGLAAEAVTGLLGHLFADLGLHRVYASIDPRNTPSASLFDRLGFRREALFRRSLWFKGEWTDDLVCALLAEEWENPSDNDSGSGSCHPR